ncbi:hypothetical protein LJR015_002365 [Peribacillus frigoritolerans]|uniref:hypothetical protein n=1 Tax=Peribacillus TaxID=2675229 RepID=UPI0015955655|nr:hypothetical protein [Peribacillus simplex]
MIPKLWSIANNDGTIDSLAQLNNDQNKGILGITDNHHEAGNVMGLLDCNRIQW